MLLSKNILPGILFFTIILFISCGEKKETAPVREDSAALINDVKTVLGDDVQVAYTGLFDNDNDELIAAGMEINTKDTWGIKFFMLKKEDNSLKKVFETGILDGSFKSSATAKLKLPSYNYEMLYYNSLDYFIGSGGGEVFSYIINLSGKEVYYAHLVIEGKQISLFLSENIEDDEVKNFFINIFRKDYPEFTVVDKDIRLDN